MARMKDCPECKAGNTLEPDDSPDFYATLTPREARKEHSYCGLRTTGGAGGGPDPWSKLMFRPNGEYVTPLIHNGRK